MDALYESILSLRSDISTEQIEINKILVKVCELAETINPKVKIEIPDEIIQHATKRSIKMINAVSNKSSCYTLYSKSDKETSRTFSGYVSHMYRCSQKIAAIEAKISKLTTDLVLAQHVALKKLLNQQ